MASHYPTLAVVDRGELTAVWHVQTHPGIAAWSEALTGAWLLGNTAAERAALADLLAVDLVLDAGDEAVAVVARGIEEESRLIRDVADRLIGEENERRRSARPKKKELDPFTLPELVVPSVTQMAQNYRGEEAGRKAWATAAALGELVVQWYQRELARRRRRLLREELGDTSRPFPLPDISAGKRGEKEEGKSASTGMPVSPGD